VRLKHVDRPARQRKGGSRAGENGHALVDMLGTLVSASLPLGLAVVKGRKPELTGDIGALGLLPPFTTHRKELVNAIQKTGCIIII